MKTFERILDFFLLLFDIAICVFLLPQASYFLISNPTITEMYEGDGWSMLPVWVCLVAIIFSTFSFIRIAITYNEPLRERFWEKSGKLSLKNRFLFLVSKPEFWLRTFVIAVVYIALPLKWTAKALAVVTGAVTSFDKLICLSILFPVIFTVAVFAHLSAYKAWAINKKQTAYSKKEENREYLLASVAYYGGSVMFLMMLPIFAPIFLVVYYSITLRIIVLVAILVCSPFVYRFFRAISKRRTFLKRLKIMCAEKGYTLSEIQYPYISLFVLLKGESFNITIGEKVYSCTLISVRKRNSPIVISPSGEVAFINVMSVRGAVIRQRETTYNFGYESENPKIFIVNPVPKKVYTVQSGKLFELDNGMMAGKYKFFAASGFLHAAELDVLDK